MIAVLDKAVFNDGWTEPTVSISVQRNMGRLKRKSMRKEGAQVAFRWNDEMGGGTIAAWAVVWAEIRTIACHDLATAKASGQANSARRTPYSTLAVLHPGLSRAPHLGEMHCHAMIPQASETYSSKQLLIL
jgi:hypothetical protein